MRRVVGLIAFCSIVLSANNVSYAEATDESLSDKEINEIVTGLSSEDLQKLVQAAQKKGKLSSAKSKKTSKKKKKKNKKNKQKNIQQNSENNVIASNNAYTGDVNNIYQNQSVTKKKKKKKKKKKNKQQNVLQNPENTVITGNNAHTGNINNIYQNQPVTKKKKKKKKRKNRQNNSLRNSEFVTNVNQNHSVSKNVSNQSAIFARKEDANRYQLNKNKKENNADESWKYEVISASDLTNRGELTAINEPVIDKTKIQKSSIVVKKDIKLASNSEKTKVENKVTPPELSSSNKTIKLASNAKADKLEKKINPIKPLDNEKILAHLDSEKDVNFVTNLSRSETEINDKLQQIKNDRETYNLIKTPNKDLKDNIQVNKFRAELEHYRKIYALNMKKA